MTRLVTSGAEIYVSPTGSTDTSALKEVGAPDGFVSAAGLTRVTSGQRSGSACWQTPVGGAGTNTWTIVGALERWYYCRVYIKILALPTSVNNTTILEIGGGVIVRVNTSGQVLVQSIFGGTTTSPAINDGAWHRVEFGEFQSATSSLHQWILKVDGATIDQAFQVQAQSAATTFIIGGGGGDTTWQVAFDDVALNDDQGSFQNSWPGDGKVLLCKPISDQQLGIWTGGVGGVTNLWSAIDNTPPIGTATETDLTQIENPGSDSVGTAYVANTQTPTTVGVASGDVIVGGVVVGCHGEDIATGTKVGNVSIQPANGFNSVVTSATYNFGADLGALGTWPEFWRWAATAFTAPFTTPSNGTSFRVGIQRTATEARVGSCCFLGMYIEVQPSAAPAVIVPKPNISTQAVMRAGYR